MSFNWYATPPDIMMLTSALVTLLAMKLFF